MKAPDRPPLFRAVPLAVAAGSQIGEPLRVHWRGTVVFTIVAALLVLALGVFAAMVEYAPVQRVPGIVDTLGGLVRVRSPADGLTVKRLLAAEGDAVAEGTVLAVLSNEHARADGSSQSAALKGAVAAEQAAIARERGAARDEALAQQQLIDQRLAGLQSERDSLQADIGAADTLLRSLQAQSEQVSAVAAEGYATRQQAMQKRDETTAQASRLANARAALARVERDLALAQAERRLVEARLGGVLENRERSRIELERLLINADADAERLIRAPEAGLLSMAPIAQGQTLVLGQPLFTIRPQGRPLTLRVLVPARAAGTVRPGMTVGFVLRAFPQEKFGQFSTTVDSVGGVAAMGAEPMQADAAGEPVFVVLARVPDELHGGSGQPIALKPGMVADVLVPLERRSVLEWMAEPLLRRFNDSAGRSAIAKAP